MLLCLVFLNVIIFLSLAPTYRQIFLIASSSSSEPSGQTPSASRPVQQHPQEQRQIPLPLFDPVNVRVPSKVPFLSNEEFLKKYSTIYKGHLSSSQWQSPDLSCGTSPDFFDFFLLPKSQRSRFFEDKIIYDTFFKDMTLPSPSSSGNHKSNLPQGTYVELGAFDGREESNSLFFDKCLGWRGLLIEAQSKSYQKMIQNRPQAVKLSFSPTCQHVNDTAKFYDYPLSNNGMEGLARSYIGKSTIEVPCGPFTPVLKDVFGPDGIISFLSLDVEGAEAMVLNTIDFTRPPFFDVIMIEIQNTYCPNANCPNVYEVRKIMALTQKYALFTDVVEASDVYVRWGTMAWRRITMLRRISREKLGLQGRMEMEMNQRQMTM